MKTKDVHFRNKHDPRTNVGFVRGQDVIEVTGQYKYLGRVLHEWLDYKVTVKAVTQWARMALGLLISKSKTAGGVAIRLFPEII